MEKVEVMMSQKFLEAIAKPLQLADATSASLPKNARFSRLWEGRACRDRGFAIASLVLIALSARAMPTEEELERDRPLVQELMAAHVRDHKAGRKPAREVGDAAIGFAEDAKGEAAKLLLLKGAVHYYALAREFDRAADALEAMQAQVKNLPAGEVEASASKALNNAGKVGAGRLRAIRLDATRRAKAEKEIASFRAALRKNASDVAAVRGLADAYARFGDWPNALKAFDSLGVEAAALELNAADADGGNLLKAADAWWDFKAKDPAPYRAHAAALYRKALDGGLVDGLRKTLAETRIAEAGGRAAPRAEGGSSFVPALGGTRSRASASNAGLYCVINLFGGPHASSYPVSYQNSSPSGGWPDEYKTTKLVLRRIEPGTFIMGEDQLNESHRVTFTKPFYIGVFEVTQKQYALVTGDDPSAYKGPMRPVTDISIEQLRGSCVEYDWPASRKAAPDSFIGRIRARTGLDGLELPTEAQWEYACRAGTMTLRYDGSGVYDIESLMKLGRVLYNQKSRRGGESDADFKKHCPDNKGGYPDFHTNAGLYKPNAWGLYDMYGNVWELCVSRKYETFGEDPLGRVKGSREGRALHGGGFHTPFSNVTSAKRFWEAPWWSRYDTGFRLVLNVDESGAVAALGGARSRASVSAGESRRPGATGGTGQPTASANLVRNGSFEADAVADGSRDKSTAVTGWSQTGSVALIRKDGKRAWKQRDDATTRCYLKKGASIIQSVVVPARARYRISLKKLNVNWYNNGKHFWPTKGYVKIDNATVIPDLSTDGGNERPFSATVELAPGIHRLKIACTDGVAMAVDDVKLIQVP